MKDVINYYYDLVIDRIYENNSKYFFYEDNKYYIIECINGNKLKKLNALIEELFNNKIVVSKIIETKNKKYSFTYKNQEYVIVMMPIIESTSVNLKDILKYNININDKFDFIKVNEIENMKNIVDYYEEVMSGYREEYMLIQTYFNYYVGLAENSISYLNDISDSSDIVYSISHDHINKCIEGELADISNITYNYRMKDIASYIRYKIINKEEWVREIEWFFNSFKLNDFDYKFIYSNVIFPSYFFDLIKLIINDKVSEEEIKKYTDNITYIEKEYNRLYNIICKYNKIVKIDWIK